MNWHMINSANFGIYGIPAWTKFTLSVGLICLLMSGIDLSLDLSESAGDFYLNTLL